eukprot:8427622-Alexandrium_andersonii.AAC.1
MSMWPRLSSGMSGKGWRGRGKATARSKEAQEAAGADATHLAFCVSFPCRPLEAVDLFDRRDGCLLHSPWLHSRSWGAASGG